MYRCQICNSLVPAGTHCYKFIQETRKKDYPFRPRVNPGYFSSGKQTFKSEKGRDRTPDNGGSGWEIVREINCCQKCFAKLEKDAKINE